jgi:hypothetical protein
VLDWVVAHFFSSLSLADFQALVRRGAGNDPPAEVTYICTMSAQSAGATGCNASKPIEARVHNVVDFSLEILLLHPQPD